MDAQGLVTATTPRPVILCFAGDVWDGNPHSRHHLMRRLAAHFDVLFVEGVPMRRPGIQDARRVTRLVSRVASSGRLREVAPGLHVVHPPPVPPLGQLGRAFQARMLRRSVARACRRAGLDGPRLLWFSLPTAAPLLGHLGESGAVLYYQDRYDSFTGVDGAAVRTQLQRLASGCDLALATGRELESDLRELGADPIRVTHGVDMERFSRSELPPPADVASLEPPLVGYVGIVDDYLDFEMLRATADSLEQGTLVLVGRLNVPKPKALDHPRISLMGQRPYDSIPAYLQAFACCLIPFQENRLTVAVNPIKLREYLAAGRPVVSTRLPEVEAYGDVVTFAASPREFADGVLRNLADPGSDDEGRRAQRRERVRDDSWDSVAQRIQKLLDDLLEASSPTASA
jgi:glycosyltransferase involved in cell wall biosynthesis